MCAIDDSERYEVYCETTRRARKSHKCHECNRVIAKGETYRRTAGLYDGAWTINCVCRHCTVAATWLQMNCGGYLDGGIAEDIAEHRIDYPRLAFPLGRFVVGMRRHWRSWQTDGTMPVPALPRSIKEAIGT